MYISIIGMVTNTESCFQFLYRVQLNHAYYNRYNFVPNYEPKFPPNNTDVTEEMVNKNITYRSAFIEINRRYWRLWHIDKPSIFW